MNAALRKTLAIASFAGLAACATPPAAAQADTHQHEQGTQAGKPAAGAPAQGAGGMGMGGGMMGDQAMMMQMMQQHCRQMMQGMQGGGARGLPHLPPGNEKLELQMHADMMRAMSDILSKYAARLPDKK
jgi:hypothetical protein